MADDVRPTTGMETQSRSSQEATRSARPGFIAHTELVSAEPTATKAWCATVLGWDFGEPTEKLGTTYHMWTSQQRTGGGIRTQQGNESPGAVPFVEVEDVRAVYRKAIDAGAQQMSEPQQLPDNSWIATVMAPGTVPLGFWSPGSPKGGR